MARNYFFTGCRLAGVIQEKPIHGGEHDKGEESRQESQILAVFQGIADCGRDLIAADKRPQTLPFRSRLRDDLRRNMISKCSIAACIRGR